MPALFSSLAGVLLFAAALRAAEASAPLPRPESWTLAGPLGPVPERKSDALPLSDQENRGGWKPYDPMTDEFEGGALDESRWWPRNPTWAGRRPALFQPHNVEVRYGKLRLAMRKEEVEAMSRE